MRLQDAPAFVEEPQRAVQVLEDFEAQNRVEGACPKRQQAAISRQGIRQPMGEHSVAIEIHADEGEAGILPSQGDVYKGLFLIAHETDIEDRSVGVSQPNLLFYPDSPWRPSHAGPPDERANGELSTLVTLPVPSTAYTSEVREKLLPGTRSSSMWD